MLNNKLCDYKNKCMYAHNLSDQKIDPLRHKVYTIIKSDNDLKNINLISDKLLFETFLQLTKVCNSCMKSLCPGGYNCRNGVLNIKYKICYDDFMYGQCRKFKCNSVHLTTRNLIPYYTQKSKTLNINSVKNNKNIRHKNYQMGDVNKFSSSDENKTVKGKCSIYEQKNVDTEKIKNIEPLSNLGNSVFIKNYNKRERTNKKYKMVNTPNSNKQIHGIQLTKKFLQTYFGSSMENRTDTDSHSDEDIVSIINYLNSKTDSEDSCEKSIFL
jgi:hypothetical protein